jgi:prepilin-type N-terminal cleavage/methylation domain-containing protein
MGKTDSTRKVARGFTVLELLVAIAIITVLCSLLFVAIARARRTGNIRRAEAETRELAKAWKGYWAVYGRWPFGAVNKEMDLAAMSILQGEDDVNNPQRIRFMDIDYPVVQAAGGLKDPWGSFYRVDFSRTGTPGTEMYEVTVLFPQARRFLYE